MLETRRIGANEVLTVSQPSEGVLTAMKRVIESVGGKAEEREERHQAIGGQGGGLSRSGNERALDWPYLGSPTARHC